MTPHAAVRTLWSVTYYCIVRAFTLFQEAGGAGRTGNEHLYGLIGVADEIKRGEPRPWCPASPAGLSSLLVWRHRKAASSRLLFSVDI